MTAPLRSSFVRSGVVSTIAGMRLADQEQPAVLGRGGHQLDLGQVARS
jgi:hypothetical protein